MSVCTISRILPAKLSCFGDPTQNPQVICHQRNLIIQIRPYTSKHGEPPPDIYREEAAPAWFGEVCFEIILLFCARKSRELEREDPALPEILSTVRDGLARAREPGPRAAQKSLCTPEKLVSPDVLAVPSRYRTAYLFFFSFFHLIYSRWTSSLPSCLWSQRIFPSLPGSRLTIFLTRCKFSTLTTRQLMVGFYLLTFPRFPLRKKEHKSYFGRNRTHDFHTSRCAAYLLDHSTDELLQQGNHSLLE